MDTAAFSEYRVRILRLVAQRFSAESNTTQPKVFLVLNAASDVTSEGETLVVLVLYFACAIMAFQPSIIRAFLYAGTP